LKLLCAVANLLGRGISAAFKASGQPSSTRIGKVNTSTVSVTIAAAARCRKRLNARRQTIAYLRKPDHDSAVFGVVWQHTPESCPAPWAGPHAPIPYN
jgi:hypothetical protein